MSMISDLWADVTGNNASNVPHEWGSDLGSLIEGFGIVGGAGALNGAFGPLGAGNYGEATQEMMGDYGWQPTPEGPAGSSGFGATAAPSGSNPNFDPGLYGSAGQQFANNAAASWWSSPQAALANLGFGGSSFGGWGGASGGMGGGSPGMAGWISPLMSIGSGLYGMNQSEQMKRLAQQSLQGSSPWASGGGMANAGSALTNVINGNMQNDPGYMLAQQAAARTTSNQPGGMAAQAAAQAALQYQNNRIQTLSGPAGTGFSPAAGYQNAIAAQGAGSNLMGQSLASIGFGVQSATGGNTMPTLTPQMQQALVQWYLSSGAKSLGG